MFTLRQSFIVVLYGNYYRTSQATSTSPAPSASVDLSLLLSHLREHVRVNRIRGSEFFQDSDPLRSGSIAASRFGQVSG